jgi:ATP-dependent Clp protease, protease subunit
MKWNLNSESGLLDFIQNESLAFSPDAALQTEHSARLREPIDFKAKPDWSTGGQFRRTNGGQVYGTKKVPNAISIIWGQLKTQSGKAAAPESLRFPLAKYTPAKAKAWMTENKINFVEFIEAKTPTASAQNQEIVFSAEEGKAIFKVENVANNPDLAKVYIYGVIGSWLDDLTAKDVINKLNSITAKTIHFHIHSPGGNILEGQAIYNAMKAMTDKTIITFNDGAALSMASLLMMGGDYAHMAENALLMIHNPRFAHVAGDEGALRDAADMLAKLKTIMVNQYREKSTLSEAEIIAAMDKETIYTAQEALDAGFVDNIGEPIQAAACFNVKEIMHNPESVARYESLINKSQSQNINKGNEMDLEKLKAQFPALYEQVFGLGKAAGVIEGKAAGVVEGKAAGLAEGKGANVKEAVDTAVTAEAKRIKDIEALSIPGFESVIAENKFKPEMTAEKVAVLILGKQKADGTAAAAALAADGAALAAAAAGIHNGAPAKKPLTEIEKAEETAMAKKAVEAVNQGRKV